MRIRFARFGLVAVAIVALVGCTSANNAPRTASRSIWPWSKKDVPAEALASSTPAAPGYPVKPSTTATPTMPPGSSYAATGTASGGAPAAGGYGSPYASTATVPAGGYPTTSNPYASNVSYAQPASGGAAGGGYGAVPAGGYVPAGSTAGTASGGGSAYGGAGGYGPPSAYTSPNNTAIGAPQVGRYGDSYPASGGAPGGNAAGGSAPTGNYAAGTPAAGGYESTPNESTSRYSASGDRYASRYDSAAPTDGASGGYDAPPASGDRYGSAPPAGDPAAYQPTADSYDSPNVYATTPDSDYQPGNTGYTPPAVQSQSPVPTGSLPASAEPHYRPGGTSDYAPKKKAPTSDKSSATSPSPFVPEGTSSQLDPAEEAAPAGGRYSNYSAAPAASATQGGAAGSPYPSTQYPSTNAGGSYPNTGAAPAAGDRYYR